MSRADKRSGLKKYFSKKLSFTGEFKQAKTGKLLLMNIKLEGKSKVLAEHLWVNSLDDYRLRYAVGEVVEFEGTVNSYKDLHGVRKYSIEHISKMCKYNALMDEVNLEVQKDKKYLGGKM